MPEICRFFGIIIRMYYDEHNPPHLHAEYQSAKATFDFQGNMLKGSLNSRTAVKLIRSWIDLHTKELETAWDAARNYQAINKIDPLD